MSDELVTEEERMRAAEAVAGWHLGDRTWAGLIVGAYKSPRLAMEVLRAEMAPGEEAGNGE